MVVFVSRRTAPLCLSCLEALSKRLDGVTIECFSASLNVKVEVSKRLELFPVSDLALSLLSIDKVLISWASSFFL